MVRGFSFQSADEFFDKSHRHQDRFGQPVEKFEIQFIDGEELDAELAKAIGLNQANFADFLTCAEDWDTDQKTRVIIAVGEGGYAFDPKVDPDSYNIDLYQLDSLRELAELFIDEGLFGDIPERLSCYLDYDAIARDLSFDYREITLGGTNLIYRLS
ncbi:Antirestriction protein (ArdA) [Epibacterium ulvae]|uniref:Antirestriction protein (ArdA) n=1 Tax=Epibacterium ulvae TaxID=1156985 RepID=A0A1G5RC44_9RHOB|nr:antirestriction protein ArdA [Epibacterium ulvae]SCZ71438.1 Antirestriction protein (ArdA) [Epibacterium ulvae]